MAAVPSIGRATLVEAPRVAPQAAATQGLYERHAAKIQSYCRHQLGSREEAEDAVQTTFMNAFRALGRGVVPESEAAWLFKIAENVCLSRRRSSWRRNRIESPSDFDVIEEVVPGPSRQRDELIGIEDALAGMPEQQRRAILLREWQGLSYREIAEELEVSQSAVETLIFRARRSLAQGLEQPDTVKPKRKSFRRALHIVDLGTVVAAIKTVLAGSAAVKATAAAVAVTAAAGTVATVEKTSRPEPVRAAPAQVLVATPPSRSSAAPSPASRRDGAGQAGGRKDVAVGTPGARPVQDQPRASRSKPKRAASRPVVPVGPSAVPAAPVAPVAEAPAAEPANGPTHTPAGPSPTPGPAKGDEGKRDEPNAGAAMGNGAKGDEAKGDGAKGSGGKGNDGKADEPLRETQSTSAPQEQPRSDEGTKAGGSDDGRGKEKSDEGKGPKGGSPAPEPAPHALVTAVVAPEESKANANGNGNANSGGGKDEKQERKDVASVPAPVPAETTVAAPAPPAPEPKDNGNSGNGGGGKGKDK